MQKSVEAKRQRLLQAEVDVTSPKYKDSAVRALLDSIKKMDKGERMKVAQQKKEQIDLEYYKLRTF